MATHSSILASENSMDRGASAGHSPVGHRRRVRQELVQTTVAYLV